ncbi:hypothetical protein BLS_000304 [Venturia inaequalis]|uniref:Uncharacterized protein n=1 Tax=Venturia inaequalis TaxID=5025 RepID=A0A8H3YUY8_VENIN|nr:hypothetical protein BLS_000304 [Venturia inaequalis]KAE9965388.1 hypothetical protein EG328_009681 [Venturia inaequalis]KAE9970842.1 hypothetical protein EG327_010142 [Venturia inaequalis]
MREVMINHNGSPSLTQKPVDENNAITMARPTLRKSGVHTLLLSGPRLPLTENGKYPYSENRGDEAEDDDGVEEMGHRSAPIYRGHKTTGGVRLTPMDATFPALEDDTEMLDLQTPNSSFATPQSSFQTLRGRGDTNASQASLTDHDEMSPFTSFTLPARQEQQTEHNRNGAPPTRQQVLAFMKSEIEDFNTRSQAKSKSKSCVPFGAPILLSKVKKSGFDDIPGSAVAEEYDGIIGGGEVRDRDRTDDREQRQGIEMRRGKKKENLDSAVHTPTRRSSRPQRSTRRGSSVYDAALADIPKEGRHSKPAIARPSSPLKKATAPPPTPPRAESTLQTTDADLTELALLDHSYQPEALINYTDLLQIHLDDFPAIYAEYPTLRMQPWDIIQLRERLPPIEWSAAFRLKLDIFAEKMNWRRISEWDGLPKEGVVELIKGAINNALERQNLLGLVWEGMEDEEVVQVLVRTVRVERIIDALGEKFKGMIDAVEEGHLPTRISAKQASSSAVRKLQQSCNIKRGDVSKTGVLGVGVKNINPIADHSDEAAINSVMSGTDIEQERSRIRSMECATCLLTWLWFLEAVPDEVLQATDVAKVTRVFRTLDDRAVVPSRAVVLIGK